MDWNFFVLLDRTLPQLSFFFLIRVWSQVGFFFVCLLLPVFIVFQFVTFFYFVFVVVYFFLTNVWSCPEWDIRDTSCERAAVRIYGWVLPEGNKKSHTWWNITFERCMWKTFRIMLRVDMDDWWHLQLEEVQLQVNTEFYFIRWHWCLFYSFLIPQPIQEQD